MVRPDAGSWFANDVNASLQLGNSLDEVSEWRRRRRIVIVEDYRVLSALVSNCDFILHEVRSYLLARRVPRQVEEADIANELFHFSCRGSIQLARIDRRDFLA